MGRSTNFCRASKSSWKLFFAGCALSLPLVGWPFVGAGELRADGFHAPVLTTGDPKTWAQESVQQLRAIAAAPNPEPGGGQARNRAAIGAGAVKRRLEGGGAAAENPSAKAGAEAPAGIVAGRLSNNQRALVQQKSNEYMTMLAYMDPQNIIPREFPNFPMQMIGRYRASAKKLLTLTGELGADAVVNGLRAQLMASPRGPNGFGVGGLKVHPDYAEDLLEVVQNLAARGQLRREHFTALRTAAAGQKSGPQAELAREVEELIADVAAGGVPALLKWARDAEKAGDSERQADLLDAVDYVIETAATGELAKLARAEDIDRGTRNKVGVELAKRIAAADLRELILIAEATSDPGLQRRAVDAIHGQLDDAGVADLLDVMAVVSDRELIGVAAKKVVAAKPRYDEVKARIGDILAHVHADRTFVSEAARGQVAYAFQQAPIIHCLYWLGRDDAEVNALIWKQIEGRIRRADPRRREQYRKAAIYVLEHGNASDLSRAASLGLLGRLGDSTSTQEILDRLPKLPRTLWLPAGDALQRATGQNFGPAAGDGLAEVVSAVRKYRDWIEAQPNQP